MPAPAVLFDIDGTLVDSNYAHVAAWVRAAHEAGHPVDAWRVHRGIGMDGTFLLDTLMPDAGDAVRAKAKELHSEYYREQVSLLRVLPGARELVAAVAHRGLQAVLATSAPPDELAILRDVLDLEDSVAVITSAEDVERAKPDPGIIEVALDRAGVAADEAVFVGDSVWDVKASGRAGLRCIGVRAGGTSDAELLAAGALVVFDDPRDLLVHWDSSPLASLKASAS